MFPVGEVVFSRPHHALATVLSWTGGKASLARFPDEVQLCGEVEEGELMTYEDFRTWEQQPWYPERPPAGDLGALLLYVEKFASRFGQE
jgi:hypothetical protein